MLLRIALIGCFLAAVFLARWLDYKALASVLPFCFMGSVFAWELWKHHRRGEAPRGVKQLWFGVILSALMIALLPLLPYVFDWLEGT